LKLQMNIPFQKDKKGERNGLGINSTVIGEDQCERNGAEKVTNTKAIRESA